MASARSRRIAASVALAGALLLGTGAAPRQAERDGADATYSGDDWPYYHGNPGATHFSTLDQIDTRNVARLVKVWEYDSGDAFGEGASQSDMQSNPLVIAGWMYLVTPKGRLVALDAATGRERWSYDPAVTPVATRQRLRGVSYWSGAGARRILFTFGQELISVDADTGRPDPRFGRAGRVDLREGFGRPLERLTVNNVTPGAVFEDLIIMGSTGHTPGDVRAFDVRTGAIRWTFHTIPHPGEAGAETWPRDAWKTEIGANVWAGLTVDVARGLVFLPVASSGMGDRDFYGPTRTGANLFANSLVALDARTGRRRWHFQSVHHDLWDRDFPAQPTLVTVRGVPAIAQTTKSGLVYVFDRRDGRPLFPIEERPVPPSDMPGEHAWPTQPMPTGIAPFARQRLTPADVTRRTPAAHRAVTATLATLRNRGPFDPPSLQGTVLLPGMDGGAEWGGAAYDPETGLLYVNANEMAWTLRLKPRPARVAGGGGAALYANHCAACHGVDRAGDPPQVPGLRDVAARLSADQLDRQITRGGGRMPGFGGTLSRAQVAELVGYLRGDAPPPAPRGNEAAPAAAAALATFDEPYVFDGYHRLLDPDGYPALTPPWGTLSALDVNTGRWVWRRPLGRYPELGPEETGSENYGGAVVTKGGLLFIAATVYDRRFRAFDKRDGRLLWSTELPAAGLATPATYAVNGRQFVAIAAGGGKDRKRRPGGSVVAYALPR
ncbi:PQQ-binding-like beta-propeller repeat protein [Sphingomonas sp. BK235]|uniref:outer membrane protein assembly factor BamB family protein n=1 Tax=Sphingomonas sp. BK235 TaxID=2512131 RepID=UPI00104A6D3C|nr:PQQ-binding-like beta-propeller repeat protein [Sphingomonas sp. BK235]TCP30663.1 quinoprotein glucose dehydrogenase [Sphingomonas sp. BK235]